MGLAVTKQEAFWEACGYGRKHDVEAFLQHSDIDVNWKSYTHNCCPIHVASQGKKEIVEMLIKAKCDVNAKDDRDNLALHHAAMKGHADILQILLDAGSEIDSQDKNGWTSLINAAYWCQPEACRVIVTNSGNVHLKNKDERNALHEACRSQTDDAQGLAEIAKLLVECGCDLNSKSSDVGEADFTPLMFCGYHGHSKVAKILIDADCDINAQGTNGWSALHWAADRGHLETVNILLNGGINPHLEARRGDTALDRASDNMVREVLAESMNLNGSEYKISLETRGSSTKKLYIPSPTQAQCADLAASPITSTYLKTSPVLVALQEQMQVLSVQSRTKKTRRIERKISARIFEPPKIPEESATSAAPSVSMMECEFDFMDEEEEIEEEIINSPAPSTAENPQQTTENSINQNIEVVNSSQSPTLEKGDTVENSTPSPTSDNGNSVENSTILVNGNSTREKELELGHIVDTSNSQVISNNCEISSQA